MSLADGLTLESGKAVYGKSRWKCDLVQLARMK
jgi:hypothetical protein